MQTRLRLVLPLLCLMSLWLSVLPLVAQTAAPTAPATPAATAAPVVTAPLVAPFREFEYNPERPETARSPQALYESLPRFGQKLFTTVSPAAEGTAGAPVTNLPAPPTYVLGPGDSLSLRVWSRQAEQVAQDVTISPEGFIVLTQLGQVAATGQTLSQLREVLAVAYRRLFVDPNVTLTVAEQRTVEVYVTGDAVRPGKYVLGGMATVLTALYAAGGPADIGSFRRLTLNRLGRPAVNLDLYDYLLTGRRDGDVVLAPGDSLFVPPVGGEVGLCGEVRRPARYEIRDKLTLAEALELAGGLKPSAFARVVHHWRADEQARWVLRVVNVAEGSPDLAQELRDGDLIIVKYLLPTGNNTVKLMGAVKRPGYYPVIEGSTVAQLLRQGEGLTWNAHMNMGVVRRMDYDRHTFIIPFNVSEQMYGKNPPSIPLEYKDEVEVFFQEDVEPLREVEVQGAVARPGRYPFTMEMKISQIILLAGGLLPGAHVERADLLRLTPDQTYSVVPVALKAALQGQAEADLLLQRGDILKVLTQEAAGGPRQVSISGYVNTPGTFAHRDGMKVSDLIFAAGGVKPGGGPIVELIRGRFEGSPEPVKLQLAGEGETLMVTPDEVLRTDDSVAVMGRGDFSRTARMVFLQGRVASPGSYALKRRDPQVGYTVYDLLTDGGGLLEDAFPNGLVVYRRRDFTMGDAQQEDLTRVLQSFNRETQQPPMQLDAAEQAGALNASVTRGISTLMTPSGTSIVLPPRPIRADDAVAAIPISGGKLLATKGAEGNLELEPGDTVVVPRRTNTVTVLGAVPRSGAVPFVANFKCRDYVTESGGLREDAAADRMVVIHANGAAAPIHLLGAVEPGDVIVIPTKHVVRTVRTESAWLQWLRGMAALVTAALVF
jgi:protein involved in polysaccharide export with SLBB domain